MRNWSFKCLTVWLYLSIRRVYILFPSATQNARPSHTHIIRLAIGRSRMFNKSQSFINVFRQVLKVNCFACNLSVELEHVFGLIFEVRGSIKSVWNKQTVVWFGSRYVSLWNSNEFFLDFAAKFQSALDLLLRVISLDCSTDDSYVVALFADTVDWRDHHDVDIYINRIVPFFLLSCLWGKIICTEGIFSVPGIGWSRIQIHLMILSTSLTLSLSPHFKA